MTAAHKRRWLRWSLRTLFVLMTVAAAIAAAIAWWHSWRKETDEWVHIAATEASDATTTRMVEDIMKSNGIECWCEDHIEWFETIMEPKYEPSDFLGPGQPRRKRGDAWKSYLITVPNRDAERARALLRSPPLSSRKIQIFSINIEPQEQ